MMKYLSLSKVNFRHLILGVTALAIIFLTLVVAFISSRVAFNEMSDTLYYQGVNYTNNLVKDSVAPLLYESASGADDVLEALLHLKQITDVRINRANGNSLAQRKKSEHIVSAYPDVTVNDPFKMTETKDAWYFSALVLNEVGGGDFGDEFIGGEDAGLNIVLGYVQLGVSKDSIYASQKNIFIKNASVSMMAGLLLLYFLYIVLRNITRPLEKLSALMEQGRQGEYPDKTQVHGTKEISEISHVFNEMIFAIKEREQNLSLTLDSIGDAVIVTDASGCVVRMNPVAEKLTGWLLQDAKGQSVKDIFPIIDATTRVPIKSPVDKVLESGETVYLSNHTTLIAKDKIEYQIADSAAPIRNEAGDILGMVLVFNDVTEQYQLREIANRSQRNMQAIMDNSPAVIYVKDLEGCYLFINQRYEELFKVKRENLVGKTDYDLFPHDIADDLRRNDCQVIESGQAVELEETIPQDDGRHHYISVKFPLFDDENIAYATCGISTDITERLKQDEQLRRSQKMDALGKLTGGVAHDYNNMLGVVMGYADILKTQLEDNPRQVAYAEKIIHAGERGAKLTKKLLAFSSQKKAVSDVVNLNKLLLDERDMLEKVITARINLSLDLQEDLQSIHLDEGDLEDAIVNLSINAMHAIKENGNLTIATSNQMLSDVDARTLQLSSGSYVRLSVTDNGCGMDDATKDKIFEPFYTTKGEKGTGLGLAQVYGFVERSAGAIQVYSELGQGTEFVIYFPSTKDDKPDDGTQENNNAENYKGHESILIVDDESALLELTCEVLNKHGYRTVCATDAKQAIELLKTQSFDLLFTDIIMPEINGYQLASLVQREYPDIKIQLASGFSDDRHADMVDEDLQANIIQKPYHTNTLLKRVREIFDEN